MTGTLIHGKILLSKLTGHDFLSVAVMTSKPSDRLSGKIKYSFNQEKKISDTQMTSSDVVLYISPKIFVYLPKFPYETTG